MSFAVGSCGISTNIGNSEPIDHELFNQVLQKYVSSEGWVDYKGLSQDRRTFDQYLELLKNNHPNKKNWSSDERLAYWINAYNAFTLQLILDHYPVESIKDIKNGIPFVNTVWDIKFINIEGQEYDLNNIEHGIIRKQFDEPRIHFAVNCASYSCPKLSNRAYRADVLERQLDEATRSFINDGRRNILAPDMLQLSKIFSWYRSDFNHDDQSVVKFIRKYSDIEISEDVQIEYLDYNWSLNGQ